MPAHDWTRVTAGTFRSFHTLWLARLSETLNDGLMPLGYYAMPEAVLGDFIPDVLALQEAVGLPPVGANGANGAVGGAEGAVSGGGTALLDAPPRVAQRRPLASIAAEPAQRTLFVRAEDGDRVVALIEVVSRSNKDRVASLGQFVNKVVAAVRAGVHVLVLDLHPPTARDPDGIHGAIGPALGDDFALDPSRPLTFASYLADDPPIADVEPIAVGDAVPDMPLFLDPGHYVDVPLGGTYEETFRRFAPKHRRTLEE